MQMIDAQTIVVTNLRWLAAVIMNQHANLKN